MPRAAPEARMIKDLKDWQKHAEKQNRKKHQWGWFQHNAGDVEYNTAFFNHVSGADGGDTSVLAGSVGDGGMGEGLVEDNMEDKYTLYYDDIDVEGEYGPMDWETGSRTKEYHDTTDYELELDRDDLFNDLYELYQEEASPDMTDEDIEVYVSEHFDELFDKYYEKLKEMYRSWAEENANDEYEYDEDAGLDDWYDMMYRDSLDIEEALNCIDKATCNRYDLRNLYECQRWPKESKKHIQEMLKKKVAPSTLYTYLTESSLSSINEDIDDWRVGQTVFADDGYDYKIVNTLDVKDVDGYELAVVALMPEDIGNPRIDDPDFQYAVMLDSELEWGLCDTYDEAKEWYDGVNDGYYSDGSEYDDDIDWEDDTLEESVTLKDSEYHQIDMTDPWGGTRSLIVKASSFEEAKKKAEKFKPEWKFRAGYQASKDDVDSAKRRGLYVDSVDDDYGIQRRHAVEERMTPSGRRKMVSDRTMDRAVEAARTIDPNARGDYDDDFIYGDDGHGGSTWSILLSGDGSVYSSGGDDTALLNKIEQAVNDAADAYWAEQDRNWKEDMKRLNANGMKEDTVKQGKHWVNKGKEGTHGKFATKKAADAQRKAMFANGYKGESLKEGKVKDLNIEINDDGSYEEWLDKAEYKLHELAQELWYLKHPARRKEINAGGDDSLEELHERIAAASKEYDELRKQYNVVLAEYEKHI